MAEGTTLILWRIDNMKASYLALILTCIIGIGCYALLDSDDAMGANTSPTNATLVGDIWYTVWDGEAIVRGPSSNSLTSITIPSTVTIDGTTYTVTGIAGVSDYTGNGAFMDMQNLTTVTLPYTLESFTAQYDANSANYTYSNCFKIYPSATPKVSSLTTVNWDIPEGETCHLQSIGASAFEYCSVLTTFDIPDSVTTIGNNAFTGCTQYSIPNWPASLTSLGNGAFNGTAVSLSSLPQSITSVPNRLFYNCPNITQFTLHNGVTSIGESSFGRCTGLTQITIPDSVTTFGDGAFGGCTSLQSLKFPASMTSIPASVCSGCTNLATVTLPTNYTSVGNYSFSACPNLHFTLSDAITSVGEGAFSGCYAMEITHIPSGLTTIPTSAFNSALGTGVTIPSTVTTVGNYAFGTLMENGQICTSAEIIFEGDATPGSCTNTVSLGSSLFLRQGTGTPYPTGTTITIYLYGKSYDNAYYSVPYNNSNVSTVFNNYSMTYISPSSRVAVNYYAVYGGVEYSLTNVSSSSSSSCTANLIGLYDDSATSITLTSSFRYYYRTCNVSGVTGSATADGLGAFGGTGLTTVTINSLSLNWYYNPNGNNFSYANTFKDCVSLTTVNFNVSGSNLTIPTGMFYGCTNMDTSAIPRGVKYINDNAFRDCTSLTASNTNMTNMSLTTIGNHAFDGCTLFSPITMTFTRNVSIGEYAFNGCESFNPIIYVTNMTVGNYAFAGCTSLTLDNMKSVSLGDYAFAGCTSLNPSYLQDVTVGDFAFENCTSLSNIVIKGYTDLGDGIFNLADIEEPTTEERSLTLIFMTEDVTYDEYTFMSSGRAHYDRIYNIVDMGNNGFTTESSGLPADATVSNALTIDAVRMIQKIDVEEQSGSGIGGTEAILVGLIPVLVGISMILYILGQLGVLDLTRFGLE